MTATGVPLCPACQSPTAAWEIDSPVRAVDRVEIDARGLRILGLTTPAEGLEPVDRPVIRCAACGSLAETSIIRDAVLAAASAVTKGEAPRFDA